jgi:GT2 family glycosyltransferase
MKAEIPAAEAASITPDVTAAIPARNGERTIGECLKSIQGMHLAPRHVMVLNDHSTDATAAISRDWGAEVVEVPGGGGLGHAHNIGIDWCKTRYLAFINSDCYTSPDWLTTLLEIISTTEVAVVGGRQIELRHGTLAERWKAIHLRQDLGAQTIRNPDYMSGGNLLIDISRIGEIRCNENYTIAYEDVDFCRRLRAAGRTLHYEPKAVVAHDHQETMRTLPAKVWSYGAFSRSVGPVSGLRAFLRMHRRPHDQIRTAFIDDIRNRRFLFMAIDLYLFAGSFWLFLTRAPGKTNPRPPV